MVDAGTVATTTVARQDPRLWGRLSPYFVHMMASLSLMANSSSRNSGHLCRESCLGVEIKC